MNSGVAQETGIITNGTQSRIAMALGFKTQPGEVTYIFFRSSFMDFCRFKEYKNIK